VKKFINNVDNLLAESLSGFSAAHHDLVSLHLNPNYVYRAQKSKNKVALISGGGSGHEPLHAGYIGYGMLDAACPGHVFTSPTPDRVAGTVIVEKVVGSLAETGAELAACKALGDKVNSHTASMGVALTSCTVPAAGRPTFDIGDNELEMGVGIHGEPGRRREAMRPADAIVADLVAAILEDFKAMALKPAKDGEVLLLINGFGGTPLMELYLLYNTAARLLERQGITVSRSLVGNYTTSLEMAGASITVCLLDDEIRKHWDSPVHTPALRWAK